MIGGKARKFVILLRRNAEAEERALAAGDPAHDRLFEERRDLLVEELALLADRAGFGHLAQFDAMQAGKKVGSADEAAEQARFVNVAVEDADAAAAELAAVPVATGRLIETGGEMLVVSAAVRLLVRHRQEADKIGMAGKMLEGGKLQAVQRDVVRVEIDDVDRGLSALER